jgi:hypothetical protein
MIGGEGVAMGQPAKYTIVIDTADRLIIRDDGPWDVHFTVTNDAERVVRELSPRLNGRRLLYFDSMGSLDEIVIAGGVFLGFSRAIGGDELDVQMICLALAELSLSRPGFEYAIREIAKKLDAEEIFDGMRKANADRVSPEGRKSMMRSVGELAPAKDGADRGSSGSVGFERDTRLIHGKDERSQEEENKGE